MNESRAGTLIIGAGQAGQQVAASLRDTGYDAPITLVGAEHHTPYQRPPLSKAFLAGHASEENLTLRTDDFYATANITVLSGQHIEDISLSPDSVGGTAITSDEQHIHFDQLALTTGARPRRLQIPGAELDGVCYLRDISDARQLKTRLDTARDVVIIGGGFIGLEAAAVARQRGLRVTVLEASERLLQRVAAPPLSEFYRTAHEHRGTVIELGASVTSLHGDDGRVREVELHDGTRIQTDLVIVGIGIEPRVELAQNLGINCARGIIVDSRARTNIPGIVAAGDCTVQPHLFFPEERIALESVQNAVDQARTAAATLTGAPRPGAAVPWFWSDQSDIKLQTAGLSHGYDHHVVRGKPENEEFSVLYYRAGRLIAADAVNQPHDFMAVKRALGKKATIDPLMAMNSAVPLKTLIRER